MLRRPNRHEAALLFRCQRASVAARVHGPTNFLCATWRRSKDTYFYYSYIN